MVIFGIQDVFHNKLNRKTLVIEQGQRAVKNETGIDDHVAGGSDDPGAFPLAGIICP